MANVRLANLNLRLMNGVLLNTGAELPPIGFGTWQMRSREAEKSVKNALDTGYRLIDTARIYLNEPGVGRAIRHCGIAREKIFVTTKLWNASHGSRRPLRAFNASLKRLGLEYIDLYLIHWPIAGKRQQSWQALTEIYHSGRAKAVGVSNYTVRHLEELLSHSDMVPAVNQVEFHPFIYKEQIPLLDFCKKHGIAIEAYSPLAHGHRIDDPILVRIARKRNKSVTQVMLRWAIQHGTVPIPKSRNPVRIRENTDVFDFTLAEQEMDEINALSDGMRTCWNPENIL